MPCSSSSEPVSTVHVIVDALQGTLWVLWEGGVPAGSVLSGLQAPLWLGLAGSALPGGLEVVRARETPSAAALQLAQAVRTQLRAWLEAEAGFLRAQAGPEDSNRVRFYGKQMPFLRTFYFLLRLGSEFPAVPLSPALLSRLLDDLAARIDTVRRFPELFADPQKEKASDTLFVGSHTFRGEAGVLRTFPDGSAQLRLRRSVWGNSGNSGNSGSQESQGSQETGGNQGNQGNPSENPEKREIGGSEGEEILEGRLHKFGWFLVGEGGLAVATRGFEGVEVAWFPRGGEGGLEIAQFRGEAKREATLQGMRSQCFFVDFPRWVASRLLGGAKAGSAQFEQSLQGDAGSQFLLLPLFRNGWSRALRAILWEEGLDETVRRSQFLRYVEDPEMPVKAPVVLSQDAALLGHVQKIEAAWRPSLQQVAIVETENRSPFLNPQRAFFAITSAIYRELRAILQFHARFENGSEVLQAANNLLRFINDDRTRNGRKWADYESLPKKLRVLLKRVFPAGLTVSECQNCLKELIPQIDTFLAALPLLYDYQAMTLRTLVAFELDSALLLEDVSSPFSSQNRGNSAPALFVTRRVSTILQSETPIRGLCVLLQALRWAYSDSLRSLAIQHLLKWEFPWSDRGNVELLESLCLVYQIVECIAAKGEASSELLDFLFDLTERIEQLRSISLDARVWPAETLFSQWFHRLCFVLLYSPRSLRRAHLARLISFLKRPLPHADAEFVSSTLALLLRGGSLSELFE